MLLNNDPAWEFPATQRGCRPSAKNVIVGEAHVSMFSMEPKNGLLIYIATES
jgi:hypothetical protein